MHPIVPKIFLNIVFPLCLLFAVVVRPCLLSAFYGILLLIWPFAPGIDGTVPDFTKGYLLISMVVTGFGLLTQILFHIVLGAMGHPEDLLPDCGEMATILRFVGLQRLNITNSGHAFRLISSDIVACLASVSTYVILLYYARRPNGNTGPADPSQQQTRTYRSRASGKKKDSGQENVADGVATNRNVDDVQAAYVARLLIVCTTRLSEALVVLLLCVATVIHPSLLSSVYFLSFLFAMTWWAFYKPISASSFNVAKLLLAAYSAFHLVVLYLYQTKKFQTVLPPESITARLFGLTVIINATCFEFWNLNFVADNQWPIFANPVVIFVFYFYVALQTSSKYRAGYQAVFDGWKAVSTLIQGSSTNPCSTSNEELLTHESEEDGDSQIPGGLFVNDASPGDRSHLVKRSSTKNRINRDYRRLFSIGTVPPDHTEHKAFDAALAFIVRHSYALALGMMMAWAITYHSWLSFVWLALACIIWMMADSRQACFLLSPFIVFYAEVLLCLQFIYGLNLTQAELPDAYELTGVPLRQIGLMRPSEAPCIPLFIKAFFSIPFWITLRLRMRERNHREEDAGTFSSQTPSRSVTFESTHSTGSGVVANSLVGFLLVKYWIYVVGLVLLLISIRTPVVAYKICYMVFFVVLITVLQVSFTIWRLMLFFYWMILTAFSIGVLLLVYTYQFSEVPNWWHNWTQWPSETFRDLGLLSYYPGTLFIQLLTPISFLIVVILQMKFFHSSFMRLTDFSGRAQKMRLETSASVPEPERFATIRKYYEIGCNFLWRFAAIHFSKFVAFAIITLALSEVCAVNLMFIVLVCCMLPCHQLNTVLSIVATVWAALVVVAKMIYQMNFVDVSFLAFYEKNCTTFAFIEDPGTWAGFSRLDPSIAVGRYLKGYVAVLVMLTFQAIIKIRQRYCREVLCEHSAPRGTLFPGIGRQDADADVTRCLKFLANYGFYKFGLEITFITLVIDAGIRMDAVAFIYSIWLLVMLALPRRTLARVWWTFVAFVAASLCTQYALCVGLPPSACYQYPWSSLSSKLTYWLFLPNYEMKPNQYFLIGDFFLLLMASSQFYVFRVELSRSESTPPEGGDNTPIWQYNFNRRTEAMEMENGHDGGSETEMENPTPNFITSTKSCLDLVKMFIFVYFHWITLFVIFAAGVGGISGFAFGYLVAAFALLWKGNDLYLEPHSRLMIRWYMLLFYNVFAIMLKISLQIVGCVYICSVCDSSTSWVVQLFSIACLRGQEEKCVSTTHSSKCSVSKSEAEIFYDAICFVFLIFQLRIFSSWYFRHSIAEFRAERILSARGAHLINQLIRKEMHEQTTKEDRILKRVKAKTSRIRKHYLKQMEGKKHFEPSTYAETKRGGDYYMFAYDSDDAEEFEELQENEPTAPETSGRSERKTLGPGQLLHIAGQKSFDMCEALSEAGKREAVIKRDLSFGVQSPASSPVDVTDVIAEMEAIQEDAHGSQKPVEEQPVKTRAKKCVDCIRFLAMFVGSILNSLAFTFNRWSRDYRYVAFVLKGEKRRLKETLIRELQHEKDLRRVRQTIFKQEISRKIHYVQTMQDVATAERESQESALEHNVVARFLMATYYLLVSHTEMLCYLMIVLDHMGNAAIISLPLPLLAFFWGTLCSPRPPKFFWVTIITYTEAMIVVKFMFQFGFWQFDKSHELNPFYGPMLLGIEQKPHYAAYDVALLMCLFFHRYVLKTLGLWKDAHHEEEICETDESFLDGEQQTADQERPGEEVEGVSTNNADISEAESLAIIEAENWARRKSAAMQGRLAYCTSVLSFYRRLLNPPFRYVMDLYVYMFLCDLICFLILALGYSAFGEVRGREYYVISDIQQNKVPLPFVTMLIMLMFLIIVDRAVYLSKSVVSKLIFQYLLVTVVHGWIFFGLPAMTDWPISRNAPAQLWYFVKCVYFLLSAWQIRNSYPSRIQGNLLAKKFGLTNYCLFTGFMAAPFLFELRTLIDWIWTETSMPLFDYFTMENMYACIFRSKCMRQYEREYPVPRDIPKPKWIKYGLGLPILILIVVLLWLPLLLFALVNAIGYRVAPDEARFSVVIEGYQPLYVMEAQKKLYLHQITDTQYSNLYEMCTKDKQAISFLKQYWEADIFMAHFRSGSVSDWTISPPSREALLNDLKTGTEDININFEWHFTRPSQGLKQLPQTHISQTNVALKRKDATMEEIAEDNKIRQEIIDALEGRGKGGVYIPHAFPPFLILPSVGMVQPAKPVLYTGNTNTTNTDIQPTFAGVKLFLDIMRGSDRNGTTTEYWTMKMVPPRWMTTSAYAKPDGDVEVTVFVDRVFPTYLDTFTSGGIMGLYVVVVLAAGRFIRTLVVQSPLDVILNEMPDVDRVLQLCLDVFLVREAGDFLLEQDLFAKLIFLFRSPETLIRWTRPKVE